MYYVNHLMTTIISAKCVGACVITEIKNVYQIVRVHEV